MKIKKFQEGGMVPAEPAAAPAPQAEDQMMQQIAQMAQEVIGQLGPEAAMLLAQAIVEMVQGGAPVEAAPQGEPVFKKGGKICKRKCACGAKISKSKKRC